MKIVAYKPPPLEDEADSSSGARRPKTRERTPQISVAMSLGRASIVLAAMIALSRIAGYGRLVLTSYLYGVGPKTDAYNAAFNIPDTVSILIAGGALATGFVPVFTDYLVKGNVEAAQRTFRAMWTLLFMAFGVITVVLYLLTYTPAALYLAPQKVQPQVIELYLKLLRILLVAQFVFVLGGLFAGTLNALRLFWFPALQPVFFNLGIIGLGIVGPLFLHMDIESQAWGALIGAIVGSLVLQIPALRRQGLSLLPLWDRNDPGVQRVLRTLLPIAFGLSSGQIIALSLPRMFGAYLPPDSITLLDNANRLMQVPIAVLASGPAIALYPTLSALWAEGKEPELREQLSKALRRTLLFMLLAVALLMALREAIIHLLLEHGKFSKNDTAATAAVLFAYAGGLLGLGVQQLLARGFYAIGNTRAPITIGLATMVIFVSLASTTLKVVPQASGAVGLALSATIAISFLAVFMWMILSIKLGGLENRPALSVFFKGVLCAVAAYYTANVVQHWTAIVVSAYDGESVQTWMRLAARATIVLMGASSGVLVFMLAAVLLRVPEMKPLTRRFNNWRTRGKYLRPVDIPD